jgi:ribose transport system permease protein
VTTTTDADKLPGGVSGRSWLPAVDANWIRERGVYAALGLLTIYNVVFTNHFNHYSSLETLMSQTPAVLIVSLGMLMVIGTGGIDLSVGATMAIAAAVLGIMVAATNRGGHNASLTLAIILALLAGLAVGIFNGVVIGVVGVQPIVATLSLLVAGRGIALVITNGHLLELFRPGLSKIGRGQFAKVPYVMIIALVLLVLVTILMRRTTFGFRSVAIGGNLPASVLAGLPVRRTIITVYALCGVFAAIAGVLATARLRSADPSYVGLGLELNAITAVVVGGSALSGGKVRILGTFAGVVLMQLLTTTLTSHNIPSSATSMAQAIIIVAAVYIQRTSASIE